MICESFGAGTTELEGMDNDNAAGGKAGKGGSALEEATDDRNATEVFGLPVCCSSGAATTAFDEGNNGNDDEAAFGLDVCCPSGTLS